MNMIKYVKFVCSPKGIFWIRIRRKNLWQDEIEIATPNTDLTMETVYRKTIFAPFSSALTVLAVRLAEAFVI